MRTKASVMGMPLHPMLIVIPLGALPTVLVFDVLHVWTGDPAWWAGAFVASAVAAVALLLGMIPGLIDYSSSVPRRGEVWKHASVHMLLGLALVGYYVAHAAARWMTLAEPTSSIAWGALGMNALGLVGIVIQSTTGRTLVLRHYFGVERHDIPHASPTGGSGLAGGVSTQTAGTTSARASFGAAHETEDLQEAEETQEGREAEAEEERRRARRRDRAA